MREGFAFSGRLCCQNAQAVQVGFSRLREIGSARFRQDAGKVWESFLQGLEARLIPMGEFRTYLLLALCLCVHLAWIAALAYAVVVDVKTRFVPMASLVIGIMAWCAAAALGAAWGACPFLYAFADSHTILWVLSGVVGGVATAGFAFLCSRAMERRCGEEALGGGDVKLLFVLGLYVGFERGIVTLGVACLFALIWQGVLILLRIVSFACERRRGAPPCCVDFTRDISHRPILRQAWRTFPFVPFIVAAFVCVLMSAIRW